MDGAIPTLSADPARWQFYNQSMGARSHGESNLV